MQSIGSEVSVIYRMAFVSSKLPLVPGGKSVADIDTLTFSIAKTAVIEMIVFPATALTDVGSGRYTPISNYPLDRVIRGFFNKY